MTRRVLGSWRDRFSHFSSVPAPMRWTLRTLSASPTSCAISSPKARSARVRADVYANARNGRRAARGSRRCHHRPPADIRNRIVAEFCSPTPCGLYAHGFRDALEKSRTSASANQVSFRDGGHGRCDDAMLTRSSLSSYPRSTSDVHVSTIACATSPAAVAAPGNQPIVRLPRHAHRGVGQILLQWPAVCGARASLSACLDARDSGCATRRDVRAWEVWRLCRSTCGQSWLAAGGDGGIGRMRSA